MNKKSFVVLACLLYVPAAGLFVSNNTAAADGPRVIKTPEVQQEETSDQTGLYQYNAQERDEVNLHIEKDECSGEPTNLQDSGAKASSVMTINPGCKCEQREAPPGHKWYGKAPACSGNELDLNTKAAKKCTDIGGQVVDWSFCGDGKTCSSGNKILCKFASDDYYEELAGVEGTVTWFGRTPACSAKNARKDCEAAGGTVALESKCSDGSSGQKADCCTTGKMVACVLPKPEPTTYQGEVVETYVKWFGKGPACVAANGESDCANLGGTVEKKDKCTDGTDGEKETCCFTGKKVKCIVPKITGG